LDGRKILILYATATGVSEEVAYRIGREAAARYKMCPVIYSIDKYDYESIDQETRPICIVCSTTGQGEEPDSLKGFLKFLLLKTQESTFLSNVKFGVLGLGDSSYAQFNFVAKKLYMRLLRLGATAIIEAGLADDQHDLGPDAVIDPWLLQFWEKVVPTFSLRSVNKYPHCTDCVDTLSFAQPKFKVLTEGEYRSQELICEGDLSLRDITPGPRHTTHVIKNCKLLKNERVTAQDHFQDVRLFSIDLTNSDFTYEPGDVLMVHPANSDQNVELFFTLFPKLEKMRYEKFHMLSLNGYIEASIPPEMEAFWPQPWTLDFIVRNYFDLQAVPKRYFFEILQYFSLNELEREKLKEFSTTEGQQELYNYCTRPKRTALEVFQDFPYSSSNVPLYFMFDMMGPIKPRSFSIASSMAAHGNTLQILVALVNYETVLKAPRVGLCSNWMAGLQAGDMLPVGIRKGCFEFPKPEEVREIIYNSCKLIFEMVYFVFCIIIKYLIMFLFIVSELAGDYDWTWNWMCSLPLFYFCSSSGYGPDFVLWLSK